MKAFSFLLYAVFLGDFITEAIRGGYSIDIKNVYYYASLFKVEKFRRFDSNQSRFLEDGEFSRFQCGATIIKLSWLLTAAHCVTDSLNPESYRVRVGVDGFSDSGTTFKVSRIIVHPNYNKTSRDHDIALIQIDHAIEPTERHKPVFVACDNLGLHPDRDKVSITGFGWNVYGSQEHPDKLQYIHVTVRDSGSILRKDNRMFTEIQPNGDPRYACRRPIDGIRYKLETEDVGFTTDHGDSGGPVVYEDTNIGYVLVGVISTNVATPSEFSNLHTLVNIKFDWIDSTIKRFSNNPYEPGLINYCNSQVGYDKSIYREREAYLSGRKPQLCLGETL